MTTTTSSKNTTDTTTLEQAAAAYEHALTELEKARAVARQKAADVRWHLRALRAATQRRGTP